jgi:hypothetical protein
MKTLATRFWLFARRGDRFYADGDASLAAEIIMRLDGP